MDSGAEAFDFKALKMSAIAGLATGVGSLALYLLIADKKSAATVTEEAEDDNPTARTAAKAAREKQLEEEDAADIERVKQSLRDELSKESNMPEFQEGGPDDDKRLIFSRDFVLKVTQFTHKYHYIMN